MPDPSPDNDIYRCGNQRRKYVQGGQAFLELCQLIEEERLDQGNKKTHGQLQQQEDKRIFPRFPIIGHLKHADVVGQTHESTRRLNGIVLKQGNIKGA